MKGKGANLETPDPSLFTGPIRVQLQGPAACFEGVFSAPFKRNAGGRFSDTSD